MVGRSEKTTVQSGRVSVPRSLVEFVEDVAYRFGHLHHTFQTCILPVFKLVCQICFVSLFTLFTVTNLLRGSANSALPSIPNPVPSNNGQWTSVGYSSWTTQYWPSTNAYGAVVTVTSVVPCPASTTVVYSTQPCNQGCYHTSTTWQPSPTSTWYPSTTWYPTTTTSYYAPPPATTYAAPVTSYTTPVQAPAPTTLQTVVVVVQSGGVLMTMTSTQGVGQQAAATTVANAAATEARSEVFLRAALAVGFAGGMMLFE